MFFLYLNINVAIFKDILTYNIDETENEFTYIQFNTRQRIKLARFNTHLPPQHKLRPKLSIIVVLYHSISLPSFT